MFQNLAIDTVEVQTLGGIVLQGGDFNACTTTIPDTIDTSNLCELLQVPELAETEQLNVVAKRQNRDTSIGGWAYELLDLCHDARLFIFSGRTPGDESREFTCLENGGRNNVDYIIGSHVIWQVVTHLEVIIDDTCYCAMGGDSNQRLLHLRSNIDYNFVEPQHTIATKKFLPMFKYDKSKAKKYQLALTTSLGNLWVVELIGHLGVDELVDLLQQCMGVVAKSTFGSKPSKESYREKHCHKPRFDVDCRTMKCELKLWLKANPNSQVVKH